MYRRIRDSTFTSGLPKPNKPFGSRATQRGDTLRSTNRTKNAFSFFAFCRFACVSRVHHRSFYFSLSFFGSAAIACAGCTTHQIKIIAKQSSRFVIILELFFFLRFAAAPPPSVPFTFCYVVRLVVARWIWLWHRYICAFFGSFCFGRCSLSYNGITLFYSFTCVLCIFFCCFTVANAMTPYALHSVAVTHFKNIRFFILGRPKRAKRCRGNSNSVSRIEY